MSHCKNCGAGLKTDDEFCPSCGAKVSRGRVVANVSLPQKHNHFWNKKRRIILVIAVAAMLIFLGILGLHHSYEQSLSTARNRKRVDDLQNIEHALMLYRVTVKSYPAKLQALVPNYLVAIPQDPLAGEVISDPRCITAMGTQAYAYKYMQIANGTEFTLEACLENDETGVLKFEH